MEIRRLKTRKQFDMLSDEIKPILRTWIQREGWVTGEQELFDELLFLSDSAASSSTIWVGLTPIGTVGALALATIGGATIRVDLLETARDIDDRLAAHQDVLEAIEQWAKGSGAKRLVYRTQRVRDREDGAVPERHIRRRLYPLGFRPVSVELEKRLDNGEH